MTVTDQNRDAWTNELNRNQLQYPDEQVVRFVARHQATRAGANGLDVGFGSGRHLEVLNRFGYRAWGVELVDHAPALARANLGDRAVLGELTIADIASQPFPAGTFDIALDYGVVFLRPNEDMQNEFAALHTMLRVGGALLVNFRSPESWFYALGERIDGETFHLDERAGAYAGMNYTFHSRDAAEAIVTDSGFTVTNIERVDLWRSNATEQHSWWVVWAQKR